MYDYTHEGLLFVQRENDSVRVLGTVVAERWIWDLDSKVHEPLVIVSTPQGDVTFPLHSGRVPSLQEDSAALRSRLDKGTRP